MSRTVAVVWNDGRIGAAVAVVALVLSGVAAAWWTPRGPVTTVEALVSMGAALLLGVAVGMIAGRPWAMLAAPAVFMLVFEISRWGVDGPTVDGIHLGSTFGVIAFVVGRFVHGLLVLVPLVVGAGFGAAAVRSLVDPADGGMGAFGWATAVLVGLVFVAFAVMVARPATTAPIVGPDGLPLPGSVAELETVRLGGHDQAMMIRGRDAEAPVLLYLAGGPGGTDLGAMRADVGLEQEFVVVTYEQRGCGKSYSALDPVDTLTVDHAVADVVEVAEYLRGRFGVEKIFLAGNSGGTIFGTLAAQERPDLFHALVGTGQMVDVRATDVMFWEDALAWAERSGEDALVARLREIGPPPYTDIRDYELAAIHERDWNPYQRGDAGEMPGSLFVPENTFMDRVNGLRAFLDTYSVLYPQLQDLDFRRDIPALEVPTYVVMGRHEARGRVAPAREWFDLLEAPAKEWVEFERSGHRPLFEEPAAFASFMKRVKAEVLAEG